MSSLSLRVLIDGKDLSLSEGTGVASFARSLARCAGESGAELSVLFGRRLLGASDALGRETAFFDARPAPPRSVARYLLDLGRAMAPLPAREVPHTGHVVREGRDFGLPAGARLLNIDSLYHTAAAKFDRGLGLTEVTPPWPIDVAHWSYPIPVRVRGAVNVYSILDLVPLKLPYATLDRKARYRRLVEALVRRGDAVATISQTSRSDIVAMLGVSPERVTDVSLAVWPPDAVEKAHDDPATALRAAAAFASQALSPPPDLVHQGYYLYVGAIEPKKNLLRTLEAHMASGVAEPLVMVGRFAWACEEERAVIARSPNVLHLGYLPGRHVAALMRGARAVVFPSLYEGFGLPVVEAFLCGAPVLTANRGATAEIAGDAAILVDPYSVEDIRDAFRALSAPDSGRMRADLVQRGRRRAEAFAPSRVAARLDDYYRALLGAKRTVR